MKQVFNPLTGQFNIVPDNAVEAEVSPIVAQDTFPIYDNEGTPAADDGYVKVALSTVFPSVPRIIVAKLAESELAFIPSENGKLLVQPSYSYGAGTITLVDDTIGAQPALRVEPIGVNQSDQPVARFVYNGGGTGAHLVLADSNGAQYPIFDIGSAALNWPTVSFRGVGSPSFAVESSLQAFERGFFVYDISGDSYINLEASVDVSNVDLFVDSAAAASARIVQGSGSDITLTGDQISGQDGNPFQEFWLQLYWNASAPIGERVQHNGGGQILVDIPCQISFGNGFLTAFFNADAVAEGEEIRWNALAGRHEADIGADSTFGPDSTIRPHQSITTA